MELSIETVHSLSALCEKLAEDYRVSAHTREEAEMARDALGHDIKEELEKPEN